MAIALVLLVLMGFTFCHNAQADGITETMDTHISMPWYGRFELDVALNKYWAAKTYDESILAHVDLRWIVVDNKHTAIGVNLESHQSLLLKEFDEKNFVYDSTGIFYRFKCC